MEYKDIMKYLEDPIKYKKSLDIVTKSIDKNIFKINFELCRDIFYSYNMDLIKAIINSEKTNEKIKMLFMMVYCMILRNIKSKKKDSLHDGVNKLTDKDYIILDMCMNKIYDDLYNMKDGNQLLIYYFYDVYLWIINNDYENGKPIITFLKKWLDKDIINDEIEQNFDLNDLII